MYLFILFLLVLRNDLHPPAQHQPNQAETCNVQYLTGQVVGYCTSSVPSVECCIALAKIFNHTRGISCGKLVSQQAEVVHSSFNEYMLLSMYQGCASSFQGMFMIPEDHETHATSLENYETPQTTCPPAPTCPSCQTCPPAPTFPSCQPCPPAPTCPATVQAPKQQCPQCLVPLLWPWASPLPAIERILVQLLEICQHLMALSYEFQLIMKHCRKREKKANAELSATSTNPCHTCELCGSSRRLIPTDDSSDIQEE